MDSNNSNNERPRISLNRKMRLWNRYRNYIIGAAVIIAVIAVFAIVLGSCGGGSDKDEKATSSQTQTQSESESVTTAQTSSSSETQTQATTAAQQTGVSLTVSGTAVSQDYTSKDFYSNAVFIGDFVVSGMSGFGFIDESQVIATNSMTSDKMTDSLSDIVAKAPSTVYIMVGTNDLNYGSRTVDNIYNYEKTFIEQLKSALPSTKICVLSVLPISRSFESSSSVKQTNIDALNAKMSEAVSELGITYIDVASAYKDSTGYFGSTYTNSGYNLKADYYAYMLNGIAEVMK